MVDGAVLSYSENQKGELFWNLLILLLLLQLLLLLNKTYYNCIEYKDC